MMKHEKEEAMPVIDAVIVAAVVAAFVIFGAVLAWADYQTRHLPRLARQRPEPAKQKQGPAVIQAAPLFRRDLNAA